MPLGQKGIAHLLLLILLVAGIVIGIYLVQNPAIFKPKADEDPSKCTASDAASFKECLSSVKDNQSIDKIEVTKQIVCNSKADCTSPGSGGGFTLRNRARPLTIYGTPNTAAGFKRVAAYNYALLTIGGEDVNDVTIKDLIFDDTTEACDETSVGNCNSPLAISKSKGTTIDHVTILHAKDHGIQVGQAFLLTIQNSIIYDSNTNGIWMSDGRTDPCPNVITCPSVLEKRNSIVTIKNNLIADSRVAAIEFYAYSNTQHHSSIKGNLLVHNHRDSKFIFCPPEVKNAARVITQVGGHCPGGQLAIARTEFLDIEDNIIRDGRIEGTKPNDPYLPQPGAEGAGKEYERDLGLHTTGLELSTQLESVIVRNNKIYNHTGAGIFADYTYFNLAEEGFANNVGSVGVVQLGDNFMDRNSPNMARKGVGNLDNVPGIYNVRNGSSIPVKIPKAFIFADPPVCEVIDSSHCKTNLRWYSEEYPNINTMVSGSNTNPGHYKDGNQTPNFIAPNGTIFELVNGDNNQVLASTFVRGVVPNPNSAPSPSPSLIPSAPSSPTPNPVVPDKPQPSPAVNIPAGTGAISATPCSIPYGANACTSKIVWTTSNTSVPVQVYIKEANVVVSDKTSGQLDAPWISKSPLTFELKIGTYVISSITVKATPLISASPNPCKLAANGNCTSTLILNATGYPNLQIKIREANNASMGAGASPTGRYDAPWISSTPLTFDLYSGTTVIDSIAVKGNP